MTVPMKTTSFRQGIKAVSTTQRERIGTLRILRDGRVFRYCKAGAGALEVGKLAMAADIAAAVINKALPAIAIGDTQFIFTCGSATYAENYFRGGYVAVNDATGEGAMYEIASSSAVTAGTTINITLAEPVRVALTTSSEGTLAHNPAMATIQSADEENLPVGVSPVAVAAESFYWAQCGGLCNVLASGTIAVFDMVVPGATAGSVKTVPDWSSATDPNMPIIGQAYKDGVDTEYAIIRLNIQS